MVIKYPFSLIMLSQKEFALTVKSVAWDGMILI